VIARSADSPLAVNNETTENGGTELTMLELEWLTERIIGCGIEVHKQLGPGLLESTYEAPLCVEFTDQNIAFVRQPVVPVVYKGRNRW
jgi:PD-(D/E)XK nuclease superfamily